MLRFLADPSCASDSACQRVGHVGWPVAQDVGWVVADCAGNFGGTYGCGQAQIAAAQCLAYANDVERDFCMLAGKHFSGATEAGGDLVTNQQAVVAVAQIAQASKRMPPVPWTMDSMMTAAISRQRRSTTTSSQ